MFLSSEIGGTLFTFSCFVSTLGATFSGYFDSEVPGWDFELAAAEAGGFPLEGFVEEDYAFAALTGGLDASAGFAGDAPVFYFLSSIYFLNFSFDLDENISKIEVLFFSVYAVGAGAASALPVTAFAVSVTIADILSSCVENGCL